VIKEPVGSDLIIDICLNVPQPAARRRPGDKAARRVSRALHEYVA
jgi:hypothetical protein